MLPFAVVVSLWDFDFNERFAANATASRRNGPPLARLTASPLSLSLSYSVDVCPPAFILLASAFGLWLNTILFWQEIYNFLGKCHLLRQFTPTPVEEWLRGRELQHLSLAQNSLSDSFFFLPFLFFFVCLTMLGNCLGLSGEYYCDMTYACFIHVDLPDMSHGPALRVWSLTDIVSGVG